MSAPTRTVAVACRVRVEGVVQGVGFRPFLHRLALRHGLTGWVRNAAGEVTVHLEGDDAGVQAFLQALRAEAPPLAQVMAVAVCEAEPEGCTAFRIEASDEAPAGRLPVPPDIAICPACERELLDPMNRRHHYPFITCTDCGPRYTVIEHLPYDRERTTMRAFTQCPACRAEYETPGNRRHHSETNSCPACGPALWLETGEPGVATARDQGALREAARLLADGAIVALRGFGGFHLACDATDDRAVQLLRRRKRREGKPFAVMVRDLAAARALAEISPAEAAPLERAERPVVLVTIRPDARLAPSVAPGLDTLGLMLPATPLHLLLLDLVQRPLVMTSGNRSEEPIAIGNAEARRRLGDIADGYLLHDREILSRCDDSVLRVAGDTPIFLRRARGYAPLPVPLPIAAPVPLVAVGPHLKNTFTLAAGAAAYVSPHIGDLESMEGLDHFRQALAVYRRLFHIDPEAVAHDLHPGYLSTRVAHELGLPRLLAVQHHEAHVAAVLGEHGETGPAIGVAFDGTGYGHDGATWGAEVFVGSLAAFQRVGHLRYAPLPGGDLAARRPWRVALGFASLDHVLRDALAPLLGTVPAGELALAERQIATETNCPLASSMGRLFDAAAAIVGLRLASDYEGQAAMELEALAHNRVAAEHPVPLEDDGQGGWVMDPVPLLTHLAIRKARGAHVGDLAADFHASVARAAEQLVLRAAGRHHLSTVALSGGTFQNARLVSSLQKRLTEHGLRVLVARRLPPNDGAVSYGQAVIAAARLGALP